MEPELHDQTEHNERKTLFAEVILPIALPKTFTYRIPYDLNDAVVPGKRVSVQFGKKKIYSALVHHIHQTAPTGYEAKYLHAVIDDEPVVNAMQLRFWDWMCDYYMCAPGEVMHAALPAGLKLESESKIYLNHDAETDYSTLNEKEYLVIEALEKNHELTISQVCEIIQQKHAHTLLKNLLADNLIHIHEELKNTYKPKTITCIRLHSNYRSDDAQRTLLNQLERKAPKQVDMLMAYLALSYQKSRVTKKELIEQSKAGEAVYKSLIEKNILEPYTLHPDELALPPEITIQFELNAEQQQVYEKTIQLYQEKQTVLLHGVTGSGKTHVYVKLIEEYLRKGEQVLYLLPEIALTSQVIMRLRRYFGNHIVTFHSRLSNRERIENWQRIASGKARLVLGPRSALFLPYTKLGFIIVDEEHEASFKQQDPAPRYHARDTAIYLGNLWNAKVLLGSATPSYESYHNAITGKFGLTELLSRFGETDMPEIILADVSEDKKSKRMRSMFGSLLMHELERSVAAHEQSILFQNRRGYAPMLECKTCSWVPKCINCDIHLTYHKYAHKLKCHLCGYSEVPAKKCKQCGSVELGMMGFGTERIEDDLNALIPQVRVLRLDLETTRGKNSHHDILHDFEQHKADVLVGTQMISKGLDFDKVNLVGIVNADQLLNFPDFRANEKAFQMIEQVAGRAGRRDKKGKVIIQTSNPNHKVLQMVSTHDYLKLYQSEMQERQQFHYPPYYRLIQLTLRSKDEQQVKKAAQHLAIQLKKAIGNKVIGPESPYISKVRNKYLQHLLIKFEREHISPAKIKMALKEQFDELAMHKEFKQVEIIPDVDPY